MAFLRSRTLSIASETVLRNFKLSLIKRDFRMSARLNAEIEEIKNSNPYYEKYSEKLKKVQVSMEQNEKLKPVNKVVKPLPSNERYILCRVYKFIAQ